MRLAHASYTGLDPSDISEYNGPCLSGQGSARAISTAWPPTSSRRLPRASLPQKILRARTPLPLCSVGLVVRRVGKPGPTNLRRSGAVKLRRRPLGRAGPRMDRKMPDDQDQQSELDKVVEQIAAEGSCDVIVFNAPIERPFDEFLIRECIVRKRRPNVLFLLVTEGGNPDAGYRIARCLQDKYERYSIYISGYCKSAGTLVALGANEIVMSDHGELGPLDVQMSKKDELWELQSGLTITAALESLKEKAYSAFEKFFLETERRSGGTITVRTAAEIATQLATGLYSPIFRQIDPLHIGEAARSIQIAEHYGRRLAMNADNFTRDMLGFIVTKYPSHGFVIDRQEASMIFKNVREPTTAEATLPELIGDMGRRPRRTDMHKDLSPSDAFQFLTKEPVDEDTQTAAEAVQGASDEQGSNRDANGAGPGGTDTSPGGDVQDRPKRAKGRPRVVSCSPAEGDDNGESGGKAATKAR